MNFGSLFLTFFRLLDQALVGLNINKKHSSRLDVLLTHVEIKCTWKNFLVYLFIFLFLVFICHEIYRIWEKLALFSKCLCLSKGLYSLG